MGLGKGWSKPPRLDCRARSGILAAHRAGRRHSQAQGAVPERHRGLLGWAVRAARTCRSNPARGRRAATPSRPGGLRARNASGASGCVVRQFRAVQGTDPPQRRQYVRPHPGRLRTAWHGPNMTHFARVCCDMAKLYGCLFQMHGIVEGLRVAVRWNRHGLYRSRWGNYDLIPYPGLVAFSRGLAVADVLASRLQGRQVDDSTFFRVLHQELGFPSKPPACPFLKT